MEDPTTERRSTGRSSGEILRFQDDYDSGDGQYSREEVQELSSTSSLVEIQRDKPVFLTETSLENTSPKRRVHKLPLGEELSPSVVSRVHILSREGSFAVTTKVSSPRKRPGLTEAVQTEDPLTITKPRSNLIIVGPLAKKPLSIEKVKVTINPVVSSPFITDRIAKLAEPRNRAPPAFLTQSVSETIERPRMYLKPGHENFALAQKKNEERIRRLRMARGDRAASLPALNDSIRHEIAAAAALGKTRKWREESRLREEKRKERITAYEEAMERKRLELMEQRKQFMEQVQRKIREKRRDLSQELSKRSRSRTLPPPRRFSDSILGQQFNLPTNRPRLHRKFLAEAENRRKQEEERIRLALLERKRRFSKQSDNAAP